MYMEVKNDWEKSHFYTQQKGDYTKPTACSHCRGKLKVVEHGWRCEDCMAMIDGKSFYQGRNSMRREYMDDMIKIKMEIQELYNKIEEIKTLLMDFLPCEDEHERAYLKKKIEKV